MFRAAALSFLCSSPIINHSTLNQCARLLFMVKNPRASTRKMTIKAMRIPTVGPRAAGLVPTYCITSAPVFHRQNKAPWQLRARSVRV